MSEIEELEKRWRRYKFKKYLHVIFYIMSSAILIVFAPAGYKVFSEMFKKYQTQLTKPKQEQNRTLVVTNNEPVAKKDIPEAEEVASIKPEMKKHIRPKLDIIMSDEPIDANDPSITPNGIDFENVDSKTLAKTIESRFAMTKDYDDAMFLAKYYYGKRAYRKSEHWAMQANSIDSSQEDSWIIFSKSKAKQGNRADALRVLQAYFDRTGSIRIKNLIDKIRKGKRF